MNYQHPLICQEPVAAAPELTCRMPIEAPATAAGEMMYMPAGLQEITCSIAGLPVHVQVMIDAQAASALEQQRQALAAQEGRKPYFDLGHTNEQASFWPEQFFWRDGDKPGIYARGQWTDSGRRAIEGRDYRLFSPVFHVDNPQKRPARVVCNAAAKPNMGGLVNDPAFRNMAPLWGRDAAGAPSQQQNQNNNMTPEELAALRARIQTLEQNVQALTARAATDAAAQNELTARQAELRIAKSELRCAELTADNARLLAAATARNQADARTAVQAAVARGAIPAQDTALQARWEQLITNDPAHASLLAAQAGNPALVAGRVTTAPNGGAAVVVAGTRPAETLKAFGALCARQSGETSLDGKARIAREVTALYARDIAGNREVMEMPLSAADSTDANLGTMTGTLVAMRTIEDYEQQLIAPEFLTTDYSDVPAQFGQTTVTRIVVTPAVISYDPTLGADGRPKGYVVTTPAQTVDAPVKLDQHKAVEIVFDTQQLGSTVRNLFAEQSNLAGYALALNVNNALLANIIVANFPGVAAVAGQTPGTLPAVVNLADFGRGDFATAASGFNPIGVPIPRRYCLMNSLYFGKLSQDPTLTSLAVFQKPEIITGAELPLISKFQPLEAPNLPTTGNLAAFFGHKSALVIQTRLPNDYTTVLPGTAWGNVSVITGKTGLSFLLVQYTDHKGAFAGWRIAMMYGTALGNPKGGKIIKSA